MGNGYNSGKLDDEDRQRSLISGILRRLAALETPTGTSINSLVAQVQQAIANINTTVTAAITSLSYTKAQIDNLVANPPAGSNVTGNVTASGSVSGVNGLFSGQVQSNGSPVKSQPSYGYHVATSYQAMWIDGATFQMGISASSEIVKTSLTAMTGDDARKLLNLTPYWGRYVWDAPDSPLKVFFLAADVQAAGFGPDVAPVALEPIQMLMPDGTPVLGTDGQPCVVPQGEAYSINYSQLVVPLIAAWHDGAVQMQAMSAQIAALEARLTAAGL